MSLSRPFNNLGRYEREKSTRVWPDSIHTNEIYTLRIRWPFDNNPQCHEFCVLVQDVIPIDELYKVEFAWKPNEEVGLADFPLSHNGFVLTSLGDDHAVSPYVSMENVDEMGYFVGSTDPWDLALAEMTETLAVR